MAKKQYEPSDLERQAIALIQEETAQWEDATAFVTERVAFRMRDLIRTLRKNYWGVFDSPKDPVTGRDKTWIPLTETMVESVVKNIDLDTKDVQFRAKTPQGYATTDVIRAVVHDALRKDNFGERLDETERQLSIDGTVVWKTYKDGGEICTKIVDLLNFYIDPNAESIAKTPAVIERAVVTPNELKGMTGWKNLEWVKPERDITPFDADRSSTRAESRGNVPFVELYERWGLMPKNLLTGKDEDKDIFIEGTIVVSGVNSNPVAHLIKENKDKRPYEEVRYKKIAGRWYGKGIAEQLVMLQLWINTLVNIRINRSYVAQLGLFKIRSGSGITPQMLSRLPANGAIKVNSMDDIEQMIVQEASQASYNDENVINDWAQKLTSAFEVITGESLPASTPATNAILQDRNARSAFGMVKESIGMFLQRWMDNLYLPLVLTTVTTKDIIRIAKDDDKLDDIIERVVAFMADEKLEELWEQGVVPSREEVLMVIEDTREKLSKRAQNGFFVELLDELAEDNVDTEVIVTNESIDPVVTVQNLLGLLPVAPEYKDHIVKEIFSLTGLKQPPKPMQMIPPGIQAPQGQAGDIQGITTEANLPNINTPLV